MEIKHKATHEPLVQISKRSYLKKWKAWLIRTGAFVLTLLVCGIVSAILTKGNLGDFFHYLAKGAMGTERRAWNLFQGIAILLCISLAVTPAFKMRFWNIGAEGQTLMGGLGCVICIRYLGGQIDNSVLILIMTIASVTFSAIWAVIPAIFKALWRTNETLFTLMMNYIAMQIVACCIFAWVKSGSGVLGVLKHGHFPHIGGYVYLLNIIIVAMLTVLLFVYQRYSKHGYEIAVVGESENTARYIGINVKGVIIRTMVLSGVLCGFAGLLLVAGTNHTLSTSTVGGQGFTAILVSWLAHFNPIGMVLTSFLVVFLKQGASHIASVYSLGQALPEIIMGIFFFFIISCEFLINYKVKFRFWKKGAKTK